MSASLSALANSSLETESSLCSALQKQLAPDAERLVEERLAVDSLARIALGQQAGDDELASRNERSTRWATSARSPASRSPPRRACRAAGPVGREQRQLRRELVAEAPLVGEEELELQQVAQPQRLLPGGLDRVACDRLAGDLQQRQLDDRAVDEMVDAPLR